MDFHVLKPAGPVLIMSTNTGRKDDTKVLASSADPVDTIPSNTRDQADSTSANPL
jgi:hypothetical protein